MSCCRSVGNIATRTLANLRWFILILSKDISLEALPARGIHDRHNVLLSKDVIDRRTVFGVGKEPCGEGGDSRDQAKRRTAS